MTLDLDPACPTLQALREAHARHRGMLGSGLDEGSRLATILAQKQAQEVAQHGDSCARCRAWAATPRVCDVCGTALAREGDAFVCRDWRHRWRAMFGRKRAARPPPAPAARPPDPSPRADAEPQPVARAPSPPPRAQPRPAAPAPRAQTSRPQPRPQPPRKPASARPPPARPKRAAPAKPAEPSPHEVLGVPEDASEEEVRTAYRQKVVQYHPDKVARLAPEFQQLAEQKMRELNEAYHKLRTKKTA